MRPCFSHDSDTRRVYNRAVSKESVTITGRLVSYTLQQAISGLGTHLLNVVEGVLCHVGDAHVGVAPHGSKVWLQLAGEDLDHGGLAGTVGAQHSHAAVQRAEQADVLQNLLLSARVPAEYTRS